MKNLLFPIPRPAPYCMLYLESFIEVLEPGGGGPHFHYYYNVLNPYQSDIVQLQNI